MSTCDRIYQAQDGIALYLKFYSMWWFVPVHFIFVVVILSLSEWINVAFSLPLSGGIVIRRVCWLVGWFIHSFVHISHLISRFSKSESPIFMKVGAGVHHLCRILLFTNFSAVREGRSSRSKPPYWKSPTCNSSAVVETSRYLHQIWQSDRSNFGMKYDVGQNSRWPPGGGLLSVSAFLFIHTFVAQHRSYSGSHQLCLCVQYTVVTVIFCFNLLNIIYVCRVYYC